MRLIQVSEQHFHHILAGLAALEIQFMGGDERFADLATDEDNHARLMPEDLGLLRKDLAEGGLTKPSTANLLLAMSDQTPTELLPYADHLTDNDEFEVQSPPIVTKAGDDGGWVMAWTYVPTGDLGLTNAA